MTEIVDGHLYDYPKYYDLVYGSDWRAELRFLTACFDRFATARAAKVKSLFEPACGTGRLMFRFAKAGYKVAGNDLNDKAVDFCNDRLERHGFSRTAVVGDMSDFVLKRPVDATFNTINSFRHLPSESAARSHLQCVADSLKTGGLYLLGLHLTPTVGDRIEHESWSARRGHLSVVSSLWTKDIDEKKRVERIGMSFDVYTPTKQLCIRDECDYRTYTAPQFQKLIAKVPDLDWIETFDFHYKVDSPISVDEESEDIVVVLRKR